MQGAPQRRGFTLLEMLLATLVSVLLMGALYVAMNMQIRHAQIGRNVIEQGTLTHNVLARMSRDIKKCVTPATAVLPVSTPTLSKDASTPGAPASGSADSTSAASNSSPSSSSPSSTAAVSSATVPLTRDTIQFQLGVQGGPTRLTLYVSQLPREYDESRPQGLCDLRLISYWLATDGIHPIGLARREFKQVTADGAGILPANGAAEAVEIFAPEVISLQFRYFDGTAWLDTWEGSQTGQDFYTPIGPPLAIEITLGILMPNSDNRSGGQPSLRLYRHVVPILTADGAPR